MANDDEEKRKAIVKRHGREGTMSERDFMLLVSGTL
jgi:hypothetical protein